MYWRQIRFWKDRDIIAYLGTEVTESLYYIVALGFDGEDPGAPPGVLIELNDDNGERRRFFADIQDLAWDLGIHMMKEESGDLPPVNPAQYKRSLN